jgi:hypothetical protein
MNYKHTQTLTTEAYIASSDASSNNGKMYSIDPVPVKIIQRKLWAWGYIRNFMFKGLV